MKTSKQTLAHCKLDRNSESWSKLVTIYSPIISGWLRRCGVVEFDLADLTQEVLIEVVRKLPGFSHNGNVGAFRRWLKCIAINYCRRYWDLKKRNLPLIGNQMLEQLTDDESDLSRRWNMEHDQQLLEGFLKLVENEFDNASLASFKRLAINGEAAASIANDLDLTVGQVYKYKFRVMRRLQEEARFLVSNDSDLFTQS